MDAKAVADGDTITVYVSTMDQRESACVPREVQVAAVQRSKARGDRNYTKADALHQQIIDAGYRFVMPTPFNYVFINRIRHLTSSKRISDFGIVMQSTDDSK